MIWFAETQGPAGFIGAFSGDRPFLSITYILTTSLLSTNPVQWQILGLITRVALGLTVWWLSRLLWPEKYPQACWLGLLIVVFPGFKQQPISVVYANGIILLISYFASYALMILAMRHPGKRSKILLFSASMATYAFCLFSTEYYIGLDILRLVMIWILIRREVPRFKDHYKKVLLTWLPYLILLILFLIWRVFIFGFPTYQPVLLEEIENGSQSGWIDLAFRFFRDPIVAGWKAWSSSFHLPELSELTTASGISYWILFIIGGLSAWGILKIISGGNNTSKNLPEKNYLNEIFLLSGIGLFSAGFPFWVTGLPVELTYPYDRFMLVYLFGSCLLIIALLEWIVRKNYQKNIILALLVGASIATNFQNDNTYRREWLTFQDFFHQLSWRVPSLEENTLFITSRVPFSYYSDNSLTAPLNLLYDPDNTSLELPYYLAFAGVRLGRSIPSFEENQKIHQNYRNAEFFGNTSDSLVFFYSPPGCLRILDAERDTSLPILPDDYDRFIHLSNPDLIRQEVDNSIADHPEWFGKEPEPTWCYYFEHADLERQFGNWEAVVSWINQAQEAGLSPAEPSEWLIYLEGLFLTDSSENAFRLTEKIFFEYPEMNNQVCEMISRINHLKPDLADQQEMLKLLETTDCGISNDK
ncbi:MAG: hypothetical protein LLG42_04855 [Chloroflexi bacterium]|nr:hypothetical protein [Chloroflexota bacterium]